MRPRGRFREKKNRFCNSFVTFRFYNQGMKDKKTVCVILLAVALASCQAAEPMIIIKGSDTEVNLVADFAEVWMQKKPGTRIAVTGGGSGTGIAALINNKAAIANSSRPLKKKELESARARGIVPVPLVIATDGLSVIVNAKNPLRRLSLPQLDAIFRGEIRNWKELGGDDAPITGYGRQSNSGTFEFFKDTVLRGRDFSDHINQMNGNAQIVESVRQDRTGIGYVGVGYIHDSAGRTRDGLFALEISRSDREAAWPPSEQNITNGNYPLTRPLYQYVNGRPQPAVLAFLRFCVSTNVTALLRKSGFYPLQPAYIEINRRAGLNDAPAATDAEARK